MPQLVFYYKLYATVEVPFKIAEMLKDKPNSWYLRSNALYYTDENGKEHKIEGTIPEEGGVDWKRGAMEPEWEFSDSEEESKEEESNEKESE